jgi:hypothetical protein
MRPCPGPASSAATPVMWPWKWACPAPTCSCMQSLGTTWCLQMLFLWERRTLQLSPSFARPVVLSRNSESHVCIIHSSSYIIWREICLLERTCQLLDEVKCAFTIIAWPIQSSNSRWTHATIAMVICYLYPDIQASSLSTKANIS